MAISNDSDLNLPGLSGERSFLSGEKCVAGDIDIDPEVRQHDIDLKLDVTSDRYKRCLEVARKLKVDHPITKGMSREEIVKREALIVRALNAVVHQKENYGDYNEVIGAGGDSSKAPSMHNDLQRMDTANPANLAEFTSGQLICRHYAPLMAALCTEAGMKVALVSCDMNSFDAKDRKMTLDPGMTTNGHTGHIMVVSRLTGNPIEGTTAGDNNNASYTQQIKNPITNDVLSFEEILAGYTIYASADPSSIITYNTGSMTDDNKNTRIASRLVAIQSGKLEDLAKAENIDNRSKDKWRQMRAENPSVSRRELSKIFDKEIQTLELPMIQQAYDSQLKPIQISVDRAAQNCDLVALKTCLEEFPFNQNALQDVAKKVLRSNSGPKEKLAAIEFLLPMIEQKNYIDGAMAYALSQSIKRQADKPAEQLKLAEFLLKNEALNGYTNTAADPLIVQGLPFFVELSKGAMLDPGYTEGLVKALRIPPDVYLKEAVESRWEQHVKCAANMASNTPEARKIIEGYERDCVVNNWQNKLSGTLSSVLSKPQVASITPSTPMLQATRKRPEDMDSAPKQDGSTLYSILGAAAGALLGIFAKNWFAGLLLAGVGWLVGTAFSPKAGPLPAGAGLAVNTPGKGKTLAASGPSHDPVPDYAALLASAKPNVATGINVTKEGLAKANAIAAAQGISAQGSLCSLPVQPNSSGLVIN